MADMSGKKRYTPPRDADAVGGGSRTMRDEEEARTEDEEFPSRSGVPMTSLGQRDLTLSNF